MEKQNTPIRVAHVVGKMGSGGVEAVVMNYYRHVDRAKVQFDFFADADSKAIPREEIERLGGRVYVVPPYQKLPAYLRELEARFRENAYTIVHSHLNTLSVFPLYAARRAGIPVRIAHNHSTAAKGETKKNAMKYALRPFAGVNATHFAACSRYAGEWLFGRRAMRRGDVMIVSNAIDTARFAFDEAVRREARRELGIEDRFVVGHVGRFCYQKNQDFVIDVFQKVHARSPKSVLLLIGEGEDFERVRARVESLSDLALRESIRFLGVRADVGRLYQAMDVFLLPSRYEGLPVVGIEAQAAGLPCVFSNAMTAETVKTPSAVMLGLDEPAERWAEAVLKEHTDERKGAAEVIRRAGFDIVEEAKKLEQFYLSLAE